jgi:purine-cytosine permease-like protein
MLAIGMLAAAAALVLRLRFSVVTLVLLTLATVINFATSVLGGSGPLVVGLQMLAALASVQISYLVGCLIAAHLPVRAELLSLPHANALRCIQATHFRKD